MNIWEICVDRKTGYYFLDMEEISYYDIFQFYGFDGKKLENKWQNIYVNLKVKELNGDELKTTIMPYLGRGYLVIESEYLDIFDKICKESYEKLKLVCNERDYTLINVIDVVDCLDFKNMNYLGKEKGKNR